MLDQFTDSLYGTGYATSNDDSTPIVDLTDKNCSGNRTCLNNVDDSDAIPFFLDPIAFGDMNTGNDDDIMDGRGTLIGDAEDNNNAVQLGV